MPILGVSRSRDRSFPLVWPIHSLFPYLALRHWFTFAPAPIGSTEKVLPPLSHRFPLTSPTKRRLRERQIGSRFFFPLFPPNLVSFLENRSGSRSFFSFLSNEIRLEFIRGKTSLFQVVISRFVFNYVVFDAKGITEGRILRRTSLWNSKSLGVWGMKKVSENWRSSGI